jgi:hypothetical protein
MKRASTYLIVEHSLENYVVLENGNIAQCYHVTYNGQEPSPMNPSLMIIADNNKRPVELDHAFFTLQYLQENGQQMKAHFLSCISQNADNSFLRYLYKKLAKHVDVLLAADSYDTRQEWVIFRRQLLDIMYMPKFVLDETVRKHYSLHYHAIPLDYFAYYKNVYARMLASMQCDTFTMKNMSLVEQFICIFLCNIEFITDFFRKFIRSYYVKINTSNDNSDYDYTDHDKLLNQ